MATQLAERLAQLKNAVETEINGSNVQAIMREAVGFIGLLCDQAVNQSNYQNVNNNKAQ